jgi:hypothetical protein
MGAVVIKRALPRHEAECNALAKRSIYTRDFSNPPLSLKSMRKVAFTEGEVWVATLNRKVIGFIWSRPMKPKHMPFSTAYYSAVDTSAAGLGGLNRRLLAHALKHAKLKCVEFVCEHGNAPTHRYYTRAAEIPGFFGEGVALTAVKQGTVGKDNRPYTRWRLAYATV